MKQEFEGTLVARGPKGAWTHMIMPFDVQKVFGSKARVAVVGAINGYPFRTSIMPEGDGTHSMTISRAMQAGANAKAGDTVRMVLAVDTEERTVEVPADLEAQFAANVEAQSTFGALAYSHRKEFVDWITEAKRPETRAARIEKSIPMILAKKRPRS